MPQLRSFGACWVGVVFWCPNFAPAELAGLGLCFGCPPSLLRSFGGHFFRLTDEKNGGGAGN